MKKFLAGYLFVAISTFLAAGGNIDVYHADNIQNVNCKGSDIYIDYRSKLVWQDEPYGDIEDGAYKNNRSAGKAGNWRYASRFCEELDYAGYSDWRLPNIDELSELYQKPNKLKNNIAMDFWTSTPSKGEQSWAVYCIMEGLPYQHKNSDTQYIRCVRCLDDTKK